MTALGSALPDGVSVPYQEVFSLDLSSGNTRSYSPVYQMPAEYFPFAKAPNPGEIYLSQHAAKQLGVSVGDSVSLSAPEAYEFRPGESDQTLTLRVADISPGAYSAVVEPLWRDPGAVSLSEVSWWGLYHSTPLTWDEVKELNAAGFVVATDDFEHNPPPADQVDPEFHEAEEVSPGPNSYPEEWFWAVLYISFFGIAAVIVLSLVSPVFMIAAVRQSRVYALMRSQGATRAHIRATVAAYGLVYGVLGSGLGVLAGLACSFAYWEWRFPAWPFHVVSWHLAVVTLVAIVGALVSAFVPAIIQSRQDIIAGVSGAFPGRMWRMHPWMWVGPVFLVVLGAALAALRLARLSYWTAQSLELFAPVAALLGLVGLIASGPALVAAFSALSRPLPLRLASRQLRRQATRSVPALAAIASIVFVTLVGTTSMLSSAAQDAKLRQTIVTSEIAALSSQSAVAEAAAREYLGPGTTHTVTPLVFPGGGYGTIEPSILPESSVPADYVYLPGSLSYGNIQIEPDFLDVFNLSTEEREAASKALAAGGLLMGKASAHAPLYVEQETVTVVRTLSDYSDETEETYTLPVAHVLPAAIDSVFLSAAASSTLGASPDTPTTILQYDAASAWQLDKAAKAVEQTNTNTTLQTAHHLSAAAHWSALAAVTAVVLAILGLVIALSFETMRAAGSQLSAMGASLRLLRSSNAAYFGLLTASATIPSAFVASIGVFATRLRAEAFAPDWLGLAVFVIGAPMLAGIVGFFATPTAGMSYRED
ncbi:ABC transporter permease [Corynebacterium vitaeruminis]|uniref:ABC transporter permease n=1 Tax=Corynebacterium vitaeruminis TaxID=38305 RepID=UPI0018CC5853|nr:FtsX-like permease family protein [Corynebacterium vitaeruminis]